MCKTTDKKSLVDGRHGSRLADGVAHDMDHGAWSRRAFLSTLGLAGFGSAIVHGGIPVRAIAQSLMSQSLATQPSDRILVLIQLDGGNDGLNTIVPFNNDLYYNARPTLSISRNQTLEIGSDHGLHSSLGAFRTLYDEGRMGIIQNVGYPAPDLSHFRSTDIWATASDSDEFLSTGWMGRYLNDTTPDFLNNPPEHPLAVQIGGPGLMFRGPVTSMGMAVRDLNRFIEFMQDGRFYSLEGLPATPAGDEMWFMRNTVNAAFRYGSVIQDAAESGANTTAYPDHYLGESLSVVARLIKGGLQSNIYMVTLGGFDTHANQVDDHAALLDALSTSVAAFLDDFPDGPTKDNILLMTFSEFGRRIEENGSDGTDHGTAAPMFVIGNSVNGGFFGDEPDLANPDIGGNLVHTTSFRHVYASVLSGWFGLDATGVSSVLGESPEPLPLFATGTATDPSTPVPSEARLLGNYPNPFNSDTTVGLSIPQSGHVQLEVFDVNGKLVQTLVDRTLSSGTHEIAFSGSGVASGLYLYRLTFAGSTISGKMLLAR